MVQLILQQNVVIAQRLTAFDMSQVGMTQSQVQAAMNLAGAVFDPGAADPLVATIKRAATTNSVGSEPENVKRGVKGFAFEELLMNSRAYRSAARHNTDAFSISSAAGRTGTWSMLSGISLSEMSNIAILAIPIYETDLHDKAIYDFEPQRTDNLSPLVTLQPTSPDTKLTSNRRDIRGWWRSINKTSSKQEGVHEDEGSVFGKPLVISVPYANVPISLTDSATGEAFIYGYIPIVVAKTCVFLKERGRFLIFEYEKADFCEGTQIEDIFATNGNAVRVRKLCRTFETPSRYGKGLDWTGYTIHDAATVLLRYLKMLPTPIVPYEQYNAFVQPMRQYQDSVGDNLPQSDVERQAHARIVPLYQQLIKELPPLNRQLLLYIHDLLAVFASQSYYNKMPAKRLVMSFQPALLAAEPEKMDETEHRLAADVGTFLVDNQDSFLIGKF